MFLSLVSFTQASGVTVYVIRKFSRPIDEPRLVEVYIFKKLVEEYFLRDLRLVLFLEL